MKDFDRALVIAYLVLGALLALLALGCGTITPIPTPPPAYTCATMCQHGSDLACPWATPAADGATCEQWCTDDYPVVRWDLACRSTAATCAEVDQCQ